MTDIKTLNDNFRQSLQGGRVMLTAGIKAKTHDEIAEILEEVRSFDYKGQKIFFKLTITTLITNICQKIQLILLLLTEF